jgi:hypothetical protein
MYDFARNGQIDVEQLRERLHKMTDTELLRFGQAAKYMCSPEASLGQPPRQTYIVQLEEARAEWKRRKPELPLNDSI